LELVPDDTPNKPTKKHVFIDDTLLHLGKKTKHPMEGVFLYNSAYPNQRWQKKVEDISDLGGSKFSERCIAVFVKKSRVSSLNSD